MIPMTLVNHPGDADDVPGDPDEDNGDVDDRALP